MHILVTDANGFIGQHLVNALLSDGHQISAAVRNPAQHKSVTPKLKYIECDYMADTDISAWLPRLQDVDVVINAAGIIRETQRQTFRHLHTLTPTALFKAAARSEVKQLIQISALGAAADARSAYHISKYQADAELQKLSVRQCIIRPSLVIGTNAGSTRLFSAVAVLPRIPLIATGQQYVQPMNIDDLVTLIRRVIATPAQHNEVINAVGPEALSMRQLYQILAQWQGQRQARYIQIPIALMKLLARSSSRLSRNSLFDTDTLDMLVAGNTADSAPLRERLGRIPQSITAYLQRNPATPAIRQYAQLYFLLPLLQFSLGLLWLYTAWVSAFAYPQAQSLGLIAQTGLDDIHIQITALYLAVTCNFIIGLALIFNYRPRSFAGLSLLLMLSYTLIISLYLPQMWIHPFAPLAKNLPIFVATLMIIRARSAHV